MKLVLVETPEIHDFDVNGLPAGEHAKIAYFDNAWRFLRWNEDWHGNWTGRYASADAALQALRDEMLTPA
jgi:hypothetical protein